MNAVAFAPDGRALASASKDATVRLWDPVTGAALRTLIGHTGWVRAVGFAPDGSSLASASDDATVRLWDTTSGAQLTALRLAEPASCVAWAPHGDVVAVGGGTSVTRLRLRRRRAGI